MCRNTISKFQKDKSEIFSKILSLLLFNLTDCKNKIKNLVLVLTRMYIITVIGHFSASVVWRN